MAEFHLAAQVFRSWYRACWLAVTLPGTLRASISDISNTSTLPTITSQNICCE